MPLLPDLALVSWSINAQHDWGVDPERETMQDYLNQKGFRQVR
jgi:hypothetical protein